MKSFYDIKTRNELADFLDIPRKLLSYVLYVKGINDFYTTFEIPKKNGGVRKINAPSEQLKNIQSRLAEALYKHKEKMRRQNKNNISHAFEKDKSIITNAEKHRNKRFVLNIDLEDFFESFHFGRVRGFFLKNNIFSLSNEVATVIAQISCYEGKLPQGAPSSPIITNLICEILDHRIMKIANKYKLNYTRYADDLTFSTNDKHFADLQMEFYIEISEEIMRAGFKINEKKTRLQFKDSRQVVTGLVVNEKVSVNRVYFKETRAMAHHLYKNGWFKNNGELGTLNQLEGRFAFINQLTKYNNMKYDTAKNFRNFHSRELEYQKFLFFKYFFANSKPLIVTEGKTDIVYLKAALKNLYNEYPKLIAKNGDGKFEYKISFLNKTKRLSYFLGIVKDGGSALNNIYSFFNSKKYVPNYLSFFKKTSMSSPKNPVILLFDNEMESGKGKPLKEFLNYAKVDMGSEKVKMLKERYMTNVIDNLYLLTVPLIGGKTECDIEDLFDNATHSHEIDGRKFTRDNNNKSPKHYGKEIFSRYISNNYSDINFGEFRSILDNIDDIVNNYMKEQIDIECNSEIKNRDEDSTDKIILKD